MKLSTRTRKGWRLSIALTIAFSGFHFGCGESPRADRENSGGQSGASGATGSGAASSGGKGGSGGFAGSPDSGTSGGGTGGGSQGMKWNPGHYVWFIADKASSGGVLYGTFRIDQPVIYQQILTFIDSIANEPTVRGIQLVAQWRALEGATPGDYAGGFTALDAILARLTQYDKKLMLNISPVLFGDYDPAGVDEIFPAYLIDGAEYGISQFDLNGTGLSARFWQKPTNDRLIALSEAYADRYDSNPAFEMFSAAETSINLTIGIDGYTADTIGSELRRFYQASRARWSSTNLRLCANYMAGNDSTMAGLIDDMVTADIAIGGPDVIPSEDIQANRIFTGEGGFTDYRGVVPFVAEIQTPELGGKEGTWTPAELYKHSMSGDPVAEINPTYPQYFVWSRTEYDGGVEQHWSTGVLPFIRSIDGAVSTGTSAQPTLPNQLPCPSGYAIGCL